MTDYNDLITTIEDERPDYLILLCTYEKYTFPVFSPLCIL
jgi:hypothetical protein